MYFPLSRRNFMSTGAAFAVSSLSAAVSTSDKARNKTAESGLQAQKLAWAGVRLQIEKSTLFVDPLMDVDVWGRALKDPFIPVEPLEGDRFVLVTHRHPDHFDP